MNHRKHIAGWIAGGVLLPSGAYAQVPDLVNALDAGGRAMGMGGATYVSGSDTLSNYHNPAGLGFIDRVTLSGNVRNMPESRTTVTGDIGPAGVQRLDSSSQNGATGLGHLGIAIPIKGSGGRHNGTLAFSVTQAGFLRDVRTSGQGLTEGGLNATGYTQLVRSDTDMLNLSYGRANGDGTFSWGFGLVYAINRQVNDRFAPSGTTKFDAEATGLGAQIGFLVTPKDNPDLSFGFSYRTPITLRSGSDNPLIYSEIPGRLQGGVALRRGGFRGDRDFILIGADLQYFFAAKDSQFVDRNAQTVVGAGLEYNYSFSQFRIPIRLGYQLASAGGDFFGRRDSFTYGLGIRPVNGDWGIDLNFARTNKGGSDSSIGVTYRFK